MHSTALATDTSRGRRRATSAGGSAASTRLSCGRDGMETLVITPPGAVKGMYSPDLARCTRIHDGPRVSSPDEMCQSIAAARAAVHGRSGRLTPRETNAADGRL